MDIKAKIEELVKKLLSDKKLMEKFERNPASVIEELVGVDLPDQQVNQLVEGIKAKIKLDQVGDVLGGIGKLFGKCSPRAAATAPPMPVGAIAHLFFRELPQHAAAPFLPPIRCHIGTVSVELCAQPFALCVFPIFPSSDFTNSGNPSFFIGINVFFHLKLFKVSNSQWTNRGNCCIIISLLCRRQKR